MRRHHGFTLLEMVVVVAIIALVSTVAATSLGNRNVDDRIKFEAYRFSQVFSLAQQQSILGSQALGVMINKGAYAFYVFKDDKWQPYVNETDVHLKPYEVPEELTIDFYTDDEKYFLESEAATPQIFLYPTGETSAFDVRFNDEENELTYRVVGNEIGKTEIERWDDK